MTLGRNAVGYLTESLHGAGSPQAQRIFISRYMQIEYKKRVAKILAQVDDQEETNGVINEISDYFNRVFEIPA